MTDEDLECLEADRRQAWLAYNAVQQALPDCEHVRAWQAEVGKARKAHQAAIRACEKAEQARRQAEPPPEPEPVVAAVVPFPGAADQPSLFGLEEVG